MEWMIGWWQASVQRVYPTKLSCLKPITVLLSHQYLHLRYLHAYRELWRSLQSTDILSHFKENSTICDRGIGTAAFSLAFAQTITPTHITESIFHPRCLIKHINNSVRQMFFIKSVMM